MRRLYIIFIREFPHLASPELLYKRTDLRYI
jgi:hypothetical protein